MKIIKTFEISAVAGNNVLLDLCNNKVGDTVTGEVYLQTSTNVAFTVQATVDGEHFANVKIFDLCNMLGTAAVSNAGMYLVNAAGFKAIKIVPTGSGTITVKETY